MSSITTFHSNRYVTTQTLWQFPEFSFPNLRRQKFLNVHVPLNFDAFAFWSFPKLFVVACCVTRRNVILISISHQFPSAGCCLLCAKPQKHISDLVLLYDQKAFCLSCDDLNFRAKAFRMMSFSFGVLSVKEGNLISIPSNKSHKHIQAARRKRIHSKCHQMKRDANLLLLLFLGPAKDFPFHFILE